MKMKFFYLPLAVVAALGMTACSSDDENDENEVKDYEVTLVTPQDAGEAVNYVLAQPITAADDETAGSVPTLKSIDFTENGKVVVELRYAESGQLAYVTDDATKSGNTYTMSGRKVRGKVVVSGATRASSQAELDIDMTVVLKDGSVAVYQTGDEGATATGNTTAVGDETLDRLCRTWKVDGAILDLKSKKKNIKAYEEFDSDASGNFDLRQVRAEAEVQELELSDDEKEEFERTVKNVVITKSGKFIIEYTDHESDVAEWTWADAGKTTITIKLNGEDMGNKFITDGSRITFAFRDNRCNLKLDTELNDNSNNDWEVMLTLQLRG